MYTREELIKALSTLLDMTTSQEEQDQIFLSIGQNTLDPQWSDYVFQSDAFCDDAGTVDLERVADKILRYQPIAL